MTVLRKLLVKITIENAVVIKSYKWKIICSSFQCLPQKKFNQFLNGSNKYTVLNKMYNTIIME